MFFQTAKTQGCKAEILLNYSSGKIINQQHEFRIFTQFVFKILCDLALQRRRIFKNISFDDLLLMEIANENYWHIY